MPARGCSRLAARFGLLPAGVWGACRALLLGVGLVEASVALAHALQKKKKSGSANGGGAAASFQSPVDPAARKEGERRLQASRRFTAGTELSARSSSRHSNSSLLAPTEFQTWVLLISRCHSQCVCFSPVQEAVELLSHNREDGMWVKLDGCHLADAKLKKVGARARQAASVARVSCIDSDTPRGAGRDTPSPRLLTRLPCCQQLLTLRGCADVDACGSSAVECVGSPPMPDLALLRPGALPLQLCEALRANTTCISLDLSANHLTDEGAFRGLYLAPSIALHRSGLGSASSAFFPSLSACVRAAPVLEWVQEPRRWRRRLPTAAPQTS
jgi:hypothetical protein